MRIRQRVSRAHRRARPDGANWLSFSDLMSSLLLIFILIMFYIMYQYFDMYEVSMKQIASQQYDLDQAKADLDEKSAKLTAAEQAMLAQQIKLNAAQKNLDDAESILAQQREDLTAAQTLLDEKEQEIASQQTALDALSAQLSAQQTKLDAQQTRLDEQQITMDAQQAKLNAQQITMDQQQTKLDEQQITMDQQRIKLDEQQQTLEDQQLQIEQLVGLKTRIISSLSDALRAAKISAQVDLTNGSIALESNMLFEYNKYELSDSGRRFIDRFLPVYLNVLFSEDYQPYVAEVIIEGHTDSDGDYITNLKLSQQRALAVASYVLDDSYTGISASQKRLLRKLATANGRSWSDLVRDASGAEDKDASRRVVFKFRLTDEQMIQQLKDILESEGE